MELYKVSCSQLVFQIHVDNEFTNTLSTHKEVHSA